MTPEQHAHYLTCLARGTSESLALMFALGQAPMSNTDREFLESRCNGNQFENNQAMGDFYGRVARAHGVDPKGKVYLSSLADYPGDPRAWVSGRGDVQKVCEDRGWDCEGSVRVKGRPRQDVWQKYEVAGDLVAERAEDLLEAGAAGNQEEASEKAAQQLSPNWGAK